MSYKTVADPELVYRVAELFFENKKMKDIADQVNRELKPSTKLTRESIYPLLIKARSAGYVTLTPPAAERLGREVSERFNLDPATVRVVHTAGKEANRNVAITAAHLALDLLQQLDSKLRRPIGLGLGPGRATLDFSRHLSDLIRTATHVPRLRLFAISAGGPAREPEYASTSFFNLFPPEVVDSRLGLFAEPLIRSKDFGVIKARPGVSESFEERDGIDVVISAMGDIEDEHDLLRMFLVQSGTTLEDLREQGWVGNVQYRPYSVAGPIKEGGNDLRTVTLFELDELADMARTKNKHVVLIARQCGACGRTRGQALLPLLREPRLRVFSEIVMDVATASDLLNPPSGGGASTPWVDA